MANLLFEGGEVRAVLDWEMLSLGGAEMDLGWWLHIDETHNHVLPRLEGLGTRDETISLWESGTGRRAANLDWYEMFAGFRFGIILMRIGQMFESFGVEGGAMMVRDNAALHVLARMLDIAPPNGSAAG